MQIPKDILEVLCTFFYDDFKECVNNYPVLDIIKYHKNYDHTLAVKYFAYTGDLETVRHLCNLGATETVALVYACRGGFVHVFQYMESIMSGVNYDKCLCIAARNGRLALVIYMVNKGANIAYERSLPLRWACKYGNFNVVEYLISVGADVHVECALHWSSYSGYIDIVKILVSNGATIRKDYMWSAITRNHIEIVRYFSAMGIDVNDMPKCMIGVVFSDKYLEMVKCLVSVGFDIHYNDDAILIGSCCFGQIKVVKYLVSLGADIHTEHNRPLRMAILKGKIEIAKFLVSIGADIDTYKTRLLRCVAQNGHLEMVKYLMSLGADVRARNDCALSNAIRNGHTDVAQYIVDYINSSQLT